MSQSNFIVRQVAVLGAGVMGAQIAAHCANAGIPVLLFDLPATQGDANGVVHKALDGLKKLEPAPLAAKNRLALIAAANYGSDLARLADCDLVIEAIAEKMAWKLDLYAKIAPHLADHALLASNTSGLSINALAEALPEKLRSRFLGIHFFNPPRYMHLAELVPSRSTAPLLLDQVEAFLTTSLGKGVIRALDTPNFVANRVGVFSLLAVMHHTQALGLGFDVVDALTGPAIGRPKSATFRTADVVGLDTLAHVIGTMQATLPDDPWHAHFTVPSWLSALIAQGALGQKTGAGIYRKVAKEIRVLDLALADYRPSGAEVAPEVQAILKQRQPAARFAALRACRHPQAQLLWAIFRDVFHYCAYHLADIADNARDLDLAMRWGFGWSQGPLETWQAAGWQAIAQAINEDIAAGLTLAQVPLPGWVGAGRDGVHGPDGAYAPSAQVYRPRSSNPVYRRQYFPDPVLGETPNAGCTVYEDAGVRLWTLSADDPVALLSFKSKMNSIGREVVAGIQQAVDIAETRFRALVIWQPTAPFSVGANLQAMGPVLAAGDFAVLEQVVAEFQAMTRRIKYAQVPVVAAVQGMALGGGCEIILHCARVVAALESYVGLVEAGVGLIPAGGGCKEFVVRAAQAAQLTANNDPFAFIAPIFQTVAQASVSRSGLEARQLGFLREADPVVCHGHELLFVARQTALALADAAYRPPLPPGPIKVAGRNGVATLRMILLNMQAGGLISEHDAQVGRAIAEALCGGDVDSDSLVSEEWLLALERRLFIELLQTAKTQARIVHTLETGKPLRN